MPNNKNYDLIEKIEKRLQRIANVLLLNASFANNIGLLNGKMGIAIFFYHCARHEGNEIYEKFAEELLDEISDEISIRTPIDFENGLAGIGWGIEYLVQNSYLEADTNDLLEELDDKLSKVLDFHTLSENYLTSGLVSLGLYFFKRIQNPASNSKKIPTLANKQMLINIIDEIAKRTKNIDSIIIEPKEFTVIWNYPVLLWFMGELFGLDIFNLKVEKIIKQLMGPFVKKDTHIPQKQCNRLMLALGLLGLDIHYPIQEKGVLINCLLKGINRDTILNELLQDSTFFINGTIGIAWIYGQLYKLTENTHFNVEMEYWISKTLEIDEVDKGYAGFNIKEPNNQNEFGLLNGLAGIGLTLSIYKYD